MRFTLSTDTVCDVFKSELKARGIDYVSTYYTVDGVEHKDEITSDDEIKEFYDKIRGGEMPTTSQVTQNDYEEFFGNLINKCDGDIVHVTISSGLTSSPLSARYVAEQIYEKTGRRIYIVDSLGATIATRHIVDEAERLRDADVPAEQAVERLNDMVNHIHTWFMPTDLMHLKRGGRVSGPSAYIGTALNIKPILQFDASGALVVKHKKIGGDDRHIQNHVGKTAAQGLHSERGQRSCGRHAQKGASRSTRLRHRDCVDRTGYRRAYGRERRGNIVFIGLRARIVAASRYKKLTVNYYLQGENGNEFYVIGGYVLRHFAQRNDGARYRISSACVHDRRRSAL